MNERCPWWKLSWPAVVAGLLMLGALVELNTQDRDAPWIPRLGNWAGGSTWEGLGWPMVCATRMTVTSGVVVDSVSTEITSGLRLGANILCALLLISGTSRTIARSQRLEVFRYSITINGLLAMTATAATYVGMARAEGFDWLISHLATGVLFVGIFLTCFAVIDWIGGLWSLVTRKRAS